MVTYYTALGRLALRTEEGKNVPIVIVSGQEYSLSIDELLIWVSLHWNFLNKEDIKNEYIKRKSDEHIFDDVSFDRTLERLKTRKLIISGSDYIASDALYNLLCELRIRPIKISLFDKIKSCIYLFMRRNIPLRECIRVYFENNLTQNEKHVLKIADYVDISISELILCADKGFKSIKSEEDLMDKLYDSPLVTTDTINTDSRFSSLKADVLQAVTNLHLKKRIIFEI